MPEAADMIIEITPDEPTEKKEAKVEKVVEVAKTDEPIEDLRNQLKTLTAQQETERTTRLAAEARERAAREEIARKEEELTTARARATESDKSAVENAIAAEKATIDAAKQAKKTARASGDIDAETEADEKIAGAVSHITRLQEGMADIEARKTEAPKVTKAFVDPFEQTISQAPPRTQEWLRKHPEFVTDRRKNAEANLAHEKALDEGLRPDTQEYFDFCETELGLKDAPVKTNGKAETRTRAMAAAPVSRDGGAVTSGKLTSSMVTLTPGEQRVATDGTLTWERDDPKSGAKKGDVLGLREYARRKAEMQKQGLYDKSYSEN